MRRHVFSPAGAALAVALAIAGASPARADRLLTEVRLGVLDHDVRFAGGRENGIDLNAEFVFAHFLPRDWSDAVPKPLAWVLQPRPAFGFSINTSGATNKAYAGLDWTATLFTDVLQPGDGVTFDYIFGGSINDGLHETRIRNRKQLGSSGLFHLGGEIGYRVTPTVSVGVYFDHESNGGFARLNQSLNDGGLRVGFHF